MALSSTNNEWGESGYTQRSKRKFRRKDQSNWSKKWVLLLVLGLMFLFGAGSLVLFPKPDFHALYRDIEGSYILQLDCNDGIIERGRVLRKVENGEIKVLTIMGKVSRFGEITIEEFESSTGQKTGDYHGKMEDRKTRIQGEWTLPNKAMAKPVILSKVETQDVYLAFEDYVRNSQSAPKAPIANAGAPLTPWQQVKNRFKKYFN